jgi:hypothetical protein
MKRRPQVFFKRLDGVLLRVIRKGIEAEQECFATSWLGKRTWFPNSNPSNFPNANPSKKYTGKAKELRLVNFLGPPQCREEANLCIASDHRKS